MGGDQHEHPGLVLTPTQYAILSTIPYICQLRPSPLVIPVYQVPHVVQTEQACHNESVRLFNECNNVKQALQEKIIEAIDNAYLTALLNYQTNVIDVTIPIILDYLFNNHGRVTPAILHHEKKKSQESVI